MNRHIIKPQFEYLIVPFLYLPHVLFRISAILLLSTRYFTNPPIIPNSTPPKTRLLKITIPCIGPAVDTERGRGRNEDKDEEKEIM